MSSQGSEIRPLSKRNALELSTLAIGTYKDTYQNSLTAPEIELRLTTKYQVEHFLQLLSDPNHLIWGIFEQEILVGYLNLCKAGQSQSVDVTGLLQLARIYVHADAKKKGYGGQLMKTAEEICIDRGYLGLWLHCFDQNLEAIRFYEKLGYLCKGKDPFEILPGLKRADVVMVKHLTACGESGLSS